MGITIPWERIKEMMKEAYELKQDAGKLEIRLSIIGEVPSGYPVEMLLQDTSSLKKAMSQLIGKEVEFTSRVLRGKKGLVFEFDDEVSLNTMWDFLNDLLFGDAMKTILEKMIQG